MIEERIKDVLAERGTYTLDLFRKLKPDCSFQAFSLVLNAGLERGDWECTDGMWKLPKPPEEPDTTSLSTEVHYLINKTVQFESPEQKHKEQLKALGYFKSANYEPEHTTLRNMLWANLNGYQIIPGQFERNDDGKIRRKECWKSQQVFMIEFDDDVAEESLGEVLQNNQFIRENAVALVESIRSKYDDPHDNTCNGEMRYRVFFVTPSPTNDIKQADFFVKFLLSMLPGACPSGSTLTNGAMGLLNTPYAVLDQYVSSEVLQVFAGEWRTEQARKDRYQSVPSDDISELPPAYNDAISELEFDSDGWSRKMLPCLFSQHEHDNWNSQRNAMGVFRHSDNRGYTLRCFKCQTKRSYRIKARKSARRRVKQTGDSEAVYASLDDALVETKKFWNFIGTPRDFSKNRRVIFVRSDTGVGKDFAMLMEAKRSDVMSLNPHSALSIQLHARAEKEGILSFHIKSRMHGWGLIADRPVEERISIFKENESVMCIHADRCEALLARTGNCKDVLCNENDCEVYSFCSRSRYVSQLRKAAQHKIVHYSWVTLPTDPGAEGIVAQVMSERRKIYKEAPIWVVGEVDAHRLLNVHTISMQEIEKGVAIWKDEPAGQLYQLLGQLCQPHLTQEKRFEILTDEFKALDKNEVSRQLSRVGIPALGYTDEVTMPQAIRDGYVSIKDVTDIQKIPRMYPKKWTLSERLEQLINFSMNDEPPIFFNTQSILFTTPPIIHPLCKTYVMQSATANEEQLRNLLTTVSLDIDFFTGAAERVRHHEGTRIYKIATGRYVRSSCFTYDSDWNITGLRDTIRPHLETLLSILENTPGKKFVNTYKAIYTGDELADDGLIELLRNAPNTEFSNWQAGYGMDLDPQTVMIEFGTNEPSAEQLKMACSQVYMSDTEPLSYDFVDYHEQDGIRIEGTRTYSDERVQAQYEQMTSLAQYQMANRTRPVRNPSTVLIYSSHPCPYLDNRVQWVLPQMLGSNLREMDISDHDKTEFQRDKEEKRELAIELMKEGLTNKEIANQLNYKSESSVRNLLKEVEL